MTEIELKLHVPSDALAPLVARLRALGARTVRLRTAYFDTPDALLARHGLAWRIRREGRHWVQTLKSGDGLIREEHEVPVPGQSTDWPTPELDRHRGSAAGARLETLLDRSDQPVIERFRTDFSRLSAPLRTRRGWIELSLDRGSIQAGEHMTPLCELEIELIRGSPRAVTEVAAMMIRRYSLWIDLRSKAQRGHLLAAGLVQAPVRRADSCMLRPDMTMGDAWQAVARQCVTPILAQASQIAAPEGHDAEHLHQIRVGLRRYRTALRLFQHIVPNAPQRSERAGELARQLGARRDRDVMAQTLWPALTQVNAPLVMLPETAEPYDPASIMRSGAHQVELLRLIEFSELPFDRALDEPGQAPIGLFERLSAALEDGWRSIRRKAKRFDELSDADRHRLRRQIKRLRYGLEFCTNLFQARRLRTMSRALAQAQQALGDYNDTCVALTRYRTLAQDDPRAWFAAGWLAARRPERLEYCRTTLAALRDVPRAWPRPARAAKAVQLRRSASEGPDP